MTPRSGRQIRISLAGYEAVIATVGASLRQLRYEGRDLVVPFEADEVRPGYRGTTLAPWPNRVVDGAYDFAGQRHQLALTEPERGQALHGLLCWADSASASQIRTGSSSPRSSSPRRAIRSASR